MSAFTSPLGFVQPVPGDPAVANVWGTLLNTNFQLIATAISGLTSISVAGSSNVVLTNVQGATDQERNMMFIFTGVLTGNINVLWPQGATRIFFVKNSTTGAFTLSVGANNGSGSPAGTTTVVPQGSSGMFYSDGTNVIGMGVIGTITGPDGGVWDSTGINGIKQLTVSNNPNSVVNSTVTNNNNGSSAYAELVAFNNSGHGVFSQMLGSGFTASGNNLPDQAQITTNGANGMLIGASSTGGVGILANGVKNWVFGNDGSLHSVSASSLGSEGFSANGSGRINGGFGVGVAPPGTAGQINASNDIIAFVSDIRLKTNLEAIEDPLGKIKKLRGFTYNFNGVATSLGFDPSDRHVGLAAQDVQEVQPEAVKPAPVDHQYLTVQYEKLIPLLVEANKALLVRVEALEALIAK